MNFKKTLSAILAGVMLIGSAVSVSAGNVYTKEDLYPTVYPTYCHYGYYNYYNGYFYNPIYDGFRLEANWNPLYGRYDYCTCKYCLGATTSSDYYWVNGVQYTAKDYYEKYVPQTVVVEPVVGEKAETEVDRTYSSAAYRSLIKRKSGNVATAQNVTVTESGKVYVKNPSLIGGINTTITVPGKYYPCSQVDINAFFEKNSYSLYLYPGDVQNFGTGFKMVSSNSSVVKIVNNEDGQQLKAVGVGVAYVYLYTGGGVPFMRLYVNVGNKIFNAPQGYIDVQPASWQLSKAGDSTDIIITADKQYTDVKLVVAMGNGYIGSDGKLYATGSGPIVLKAYSEKYPDIKGCAIVYVGQYVNALYDGYWTSSNGCIIGNYWNPYLWGCDGYKIVGWVLTTGGTYLPVISKGETVTVNPSVNKPSSSTTIYSNLYDLLYSSCYGDVNTLYQLLWLKYNANKPSQSFGALYDEALKEIMEDIAASYDKQIH